MANEKLVAADTLDRFITMYAGLNDALVLLKSIGNAEQQVEGLSKQRDEVLAETVKVKADLVKAKDKLAADEAKAADVAKQNEVTRNADAITAGIEAASIVSQAKQKASEILAAATANGERDAALTVERVKALQLQLIAVVEAQKQAEDNTLAAQLELDNINKKIDQAKAKVAALLG